MAQARTEIIEKGLLAALDLAASRRWETLTLSDIAAAAGLALNDFHGVASTDTLADAVEAHFDRFMSGEGIDREETPRERLFDVIMLRFEAMEPHREGLLELMRWRERNPVRLARLLVARKASADWALVSAGLDGADQAVPRDIRAVAVAYAMARAERAWRKETDPGFARTMAALDKELRALEEGAGRVRGFGRRRRPGAAHDSEDAPFSGEDGTAPEGPQAGTSPA